MLSRKLQRIFTKKKNMDLRDTSRRTQRVKYQHAMSASRQVTLDQNVLSLKRKIQLRDMRKRKQGVGCRQIATVQTSGVLEDMRLSTALGWLSTGSSRTSRNDL
ncbi:hypothetical protein Taro_047780, partial [Colocasia esculenta]|nr:hypothetical protein [Colocasia esculenta]